MASQQVHSLLWLQRCVAQKVKLFTEEAPLRLPQSLRPSLQSQIFVGPHDVDCVDLLILKGEERAWIDNPALGSPSTSILRVAHLAGFINSPPSRRPRITRAIWSRRPSAVDATRTRSSKKARHLTTESDENSNSMDLLSPAITSSITQLNRIADSGSPCRTPRPQTMGALLLPFTTRAVELCPYM